LNRWHRFNPNAKTPRRQDAKTPRTELRYPKASDNCQNTIAVNADAVANSNMHMETIIFLLDVRSGLMAIETIAKNVSTMIKSMLKQ
jgi:hypothetical protein